MAAHDDMKAYMREYRKKPPNKLRAAASRLKTVRDQLDQLVDPLRDCGEPTAAEMLQMAVADVSCSLTAVNSAVASLPSTPK